jgi:hypothetical protein
MCVAEDFVSFLVESLRYMMDKESVLIKVEVIADNLKVKLGKEVWQLLIIY